MVIVIAIVLLLLCNNKHNHTTNIHNNNNDYYAEEARADLPALGVQQVSAENLGAEHMLNHVHVWWE